MSFAADTDRADVPMRLPFIAKVNYHMKLTKFILCAKIKEMPLLIMRTGGIMEKKYYPKRGCPYGYKC